MQDPMVNALRAQRRAICDRWEELLRAERMETPLGHPDTLVFLMDWTLDEILGELSNPIGRRRRARASRAVAACPSCGCGQNPLVAYFAVAEQALREMLLLTQAALIGFSAADRNLALEELHQVVREVGQREIAAFCGVCQHRNGHRGTSAAVPEAVMAGR